MVTRDKSEYWIVNEDGQNVRIAAGRGSDGCHYRRDGENTVFRLVRHDGETFVDGEFSYHAQPFIQTKERSPSADDNEPTL
ncbi:hypothetical protein [Acetobacter persici]|uniref:Uncharacterized protein n=1 Tax=Acetobacter persici TaxID=1076596 RepID=A0A1U9LIH4_9PROT|nr:hypothetical protein [Acetobacter persici]AQT06231.1 hypothetical protein A0U91_14485 [Acetobacter persici]